MLHESKVFSGFTVDDLEKAREFYSDVLGLSVEQDWMGLHIAIPGSVPLFVYQKDDHVPATYTILNFIVEDIEGTIDGLVEKRVVFERYDTLPAAQDERGILRGKAAGQGPDIAWFKDPAGNTFSILAE